MNTTFRPALLGVAISVGILLQIVMLAFGLHTSLRFAGLTEDQRMYWSLNTVYLILGLAACLAVVRWHSRKIRLPIAAALVLAFAAWGFLK